MNEDKINELKNALREVVALITARGGPLPEDLKVVLAQVMEFVARRIQELRQEGPTISEPPALEPSPFASSQVNSFKYDPESQDLYVKFQGDYPQENGPTYVYNKIPGFIYDLFQRGAVGPKTTGRNAWHAWKKDTLPSLGAALNSLIKAGGYSYRKIA
jgi:hypothetical protein